MTGAAFRHPAEVVVERIAAGGNGVGRWTDGRTMFLPRTAPGDRVLATPVEERPRFLRGEVDRIIEPGPGRVPARCPHYEKDQCGGCQLQHLDLAAQEAAKRALVGEAVRRIGGIPIDDPPMVPAGAAWGYRNRIALDRGACGFGFHRRKPAGEVFPLTQCPVADDLINLSWAVLVRGATVPDRARRVTLRKDDRDHVHVTATLPPGCRWDGGGGEGGGEAARAVAELERAGVAATLWVTEARPGGGGGRRGPARWRARPAVRAAGTAGTAGGVAVETFEQINPPMGDLARREALALLGDVAGRRVWDLYAGTGRATRMLQAAGARVSGVEIATGAAPFAPAAPAAPAAPVAGTGTVPRTAMAGVASPEGAAHSPVEWYAGAVERVVPTLDPAELVFTNPPRTGMAAVVTGAILAAAPERVVYQSCDPATLARDLRRLAEAYTVVSVRAYDLFPQTAHVESVVLLERR